MRKFTDPKTLSALADNRYKRTRSPLVANMAIHPRDWFEAWGHSMPATYRYQPLVGPKSEWRLYPHYNKECGWEWVSEERFKLIYDKRADETKNENMVVG